MSFLEHLRQQLHGIHPDTTGLTANTATPEPVTPDQPIIVTGSPAQPVQNSHQVDFPDAPPRPALTNGPAPPDMGNRAYVEMAQAANKNNPVDDHGLLTHGTLRKVLGSIGDAFLIGSGHQAVYKPAHDQAVLSNAMQGFTHDPLSAIERVAQVNPTVAKEMQKEYEENQYKQAAQQSLTANRQSEIENRTQDNLTKALPIVSAMFNAAKGDPIKTQYAIDRAKDLAGRLGVPPEALGIHDNMSPQELETLSNMGMNVSQQERLPLARERIGIAHQNAQTSERRADSYDYSVHHKSGPAPRNPGVVQSYVGEDGYKYTVLSNGQHVKSEQKVRQSSGGILGSMGIGTPPPPSGNKFQGWKIKK